MLLVVPRLLAVAIGSVALFAALFMYEEEEGRWQNRIEELWITIDDKAKITGSKTVAVLNKVGETVTRWLNRFFGVKLVSIRSIGTSIACSSAFAFLTLFCWELIEDGGVSSLVFYATTIRAVSAALPIIFRSKWLISISYIPFCAVILYNYTHWALSEWEDHRPLMLLGTLLVSALFDTITVMISRATTSWAATRSKATPLICIVIFQLTCGIIVLIGPATLSVLLDPNAHNVFQRSLIANILLFSSVFNVFTAIMYFVMSFVLVGVLAHRVFWPALSRLIYSAARYEIVRNRKFLVALGVVCFTYGFRLQDVASKLLLPLISKP